MIDVKNNRCLESSCNKHPLYNLEGGKPIYCKTHKKDGMLDVKNNRCLESSCKKSPSYNIEGEKKPIYCKAHKKDDMINVVSKKCPRCEETRPSFNEPGIKIPLYCKSCLTPEELKTFVNVKCIDCQACNLPFLPKNKTTLLCGYCNPTKYQKTKENEIKKLLEENSIEFIHDKLITEQETCLSYKPDFVIENEKNIVILEVDEYEHKYYEISCELSRMYNIIAYFTEKYQKPVKFIRYNPDCKKRNKQKKLIETLKENSKEIEEMSIIYLFYSEERKADLIKADI